MNAAVLILFPVAALPAPPLIVTTFYPQKAGLNVAEILAKRKAMIAFRLREYTMHNRVLRIACAAWVNYWYSEAPIS
jgi:hypothetical protein